MPTLSLGWLLFTKGIVMLKSVQIKIILIFFIIGIIIISLLSFSYINTLEGINLEITQNAMNEDIILEITNKIEQVKVITIITIAVFSLITILVAFFVRKAVVSPIQGLIKSAEKIANGEQVEIERTENELNQEDKLVN